MNALKRMLWRYTSLVSVCALLMPSLAIAKPLDSLTAKEKIVKRGVGNWVCVEEGNGLALVGRITSIDQDSFGLQLHNYPEITPVLYSDVTSLRFGLSRTGVIALVGGTVGAGVTGALILHHEYEVNKPQLPTMPSPPFP
jgi:hypothetical protein